MTPSIPLRGARPAAFLMFLGLQAGLAHADALWVDAAATGPGDGSQADPFPAIQTALDVALAGTPPHIIRVLPGSYAGFSTDINLGTATIWALSGPEVTFTGPIQVASFGHHVVGFDIDGQGGVAVQASAGATIEACVLHDASTGYASPGGSLWTCTVVNCGVGIEGATDVTDCIFFSNGLDISSPGIGCSNRWQTWQHPTQGLLTQDFDPLFWDLANGDLHLRYDSPCLNIGCWVSDIGAFPFDKHHLPTPMVFCTAETTSDQCTPTLDWSGPAHASMSSAEPFVVTASGTSSNKSGVFFYGFGPAHIPALGAFFCVQAPTIRTLIQFSGSNAGAPCTGQLTFDFNEYAQTSNHPSLAPGLSIYGQYWYRDPQGSSGSALTQGIGFSLLD